MKMVGERPLNALMDGLADIRKVKVKEAFEKATIKCKVGAPSKAAPPKPVPTKAASAAKSKVTSQTPLEINQEPQPSKPVNKPPGVSLLTFPSLLRVYLNNQQPKKPPSTAPATKKPVAAAPSKPSKANASAASGSLDSFKYKHTPEDSEILAAELLPPSTMTDLADANWKTRLAALEEMAIWLEDEIATLDAEVVVRALAKKGWSEKNFQVRFLRS